MGLPNCSRWRQNLIDSSRQAWDSPTAPIAMLSRPALTAAMPSDRPPPSLPSTLPAGTRVSSNVSSQLVVDRSGMCGMSCTPNRDSAASTSSPVIPWSVPSSSTTRTNRMPKSHPSALVM